MNYYNEIKEELINNEIYKKVKDYSKNRNDLKTYYNVGRLLIKAQGGEKKAKYGDNLIKRYSEKLKTEVNKKYSVTTLKYMRKFYLFQKSQPVADQLSWSHYQELLPLKDKNEINYYIDQCIINNLSKRQLREKIKNKEFERLSENTKEKIIKNEKVELIDSIKNPVIIKNTSNYDIISEKLLKSLILNNIEEFMKELGNSFCFIASEYKIKVGNEYNYIDILLFNIEYNCYVVIELKVTKLKKEHIGQIQVYMNYINNNIKKITHNNTIGIIICKENNKFVIKYSSDSRIISKEYKLV